MSTNELPKISVDKPDRGDLETTVHALHGIWALNMLVVHKVADDVAHERARLNGIDQLIVAGELMTQDILDRL